MKVYTKAEFDCQRLESMKLNQVNYNFRGFSEVARNIHKWSDYSSKFIKFASGIELILCDEIVHCDHNVANEHLEGKTLELLAMQLAQLTESDLLTAELALNKNIDPIYEARNILKVRLENPPSILELAEQVGVSDRTLQRGFRKLFGTTVVGYLNQLRIEQAETLFRTGKLSVAEVANKVGYSHLGHFTTAFKRQFGITPSECLAGKLRD